MKVVSVVNIKGGVGKSTLTMIFAEFLFFHFKKKVLLIDMDSQANLTYMMLPPRAIELQEKEGRTMYHLFKYVIEKNYFISENKFKLMNFVASPPLVVSNVARQGRYEGLEMIISTPSVARIDIELLNKWEKNEKYPENLQFFLKDALREIENKYDIVLIDCPPGISFFVTAALIASDYLVSPLIPEPLSLIGIDHLENTKNELNDKYRTNIKFIGSIFNIVKHYRETHRKTIEFIYNNESLREKYKPFIFWLPDNERLRRIGEAEIDPDFFKKGYEPTNDIGWKEKFSLLEFKYDVDYYLSNPTQGYLSIVLEEEKQKYRLFTRIKNLVREFMEKIELI